MHKKILNFVCLLPYIWTGDKAVAQGKQTEKCIFIKYCIILHYQVSDNSTSVQFFHIIKTAPRPPQKLNP